VLNAHIVPVAVYLKLALRTHLDLIALIPDVVIYVKFVEGIIFVPIAKEPGMSKCSIRNG